MTLDWRVGVEVELMAPRGRTRRDLAQALAGPGGRVETFFHLQSEPSLVPGMQVFETLTLGFRAVDAGDQPVATVVDDLTLVARLDREAPARPGWYRIVSDDRRLLELVRRHGPADASLEAALTPTATLFGTSLRPGPGGMLKVVDRIGAPVCIGAPLPGERERPAELVTPPIDGDADLHAALEALLAPARRLGFSVPDEAATHLHLDGAPLMDTVPFVNLVRLLHTWGGALKAWAGTNPRCVRLGDWPDSLRETAFDPAFARLPWPRARAHLETLGLSKYVDYNVKNLVHVHPDKPTFEVRVLPGTITAAPVVRAARVFVALVRHACTVDRVPVDAPRDVGALETLWAALGVDGS